MSVQIVLLILKSALLRFPSCRLLFFRWKVSQGREGLVKRDTFSYRQRCVLIRSLP